MLYYPEGGEFPRIIEIALFVKYLPLMRLQRRKRFDYLFLLILKIKVQCERSQGLQKSKATNKMNRQTLAKSVIKRFYFQIHLIELFPFMKFPLSLKVKTINITIKCCALRHLRVIHLSKTWFSFVIYFLYSDFVKFYTRLGL